MKRVLHFLLLNSSNEMRSKTAEAMKDLGLNFSLVQLEKGKEFSQQLEEKEWDAVIVDGTNGKYNIDVVFERVRQVKDVPVIGIVKQKDKESEAKAIRRGIYDLIPIDKLNELPISLLRILHLEKQLRAHDLMESELQRQINFLTDVFNAVQEGICVMDTQLTVLQANEWYRKVIAGKTNPIGKKCYEILKRRNTSCPECRIFESLEKKGYFRQIVSSYGNDEQRLWFEVNAYPLKNSSQQIVGVIQSIKNITDQKNAEHELLKLNRELDKRVRQRTAQLEAANRELEAFTYSVSHDLRAPLVRIDGFSQLLLDLHSEELSDEATHYLKRIRSSVLLMSQLIDDFLSLSRIARSSMEIRDVNLSKLALQIIRQLQESEPDRKVKITIQPDIIARGDAHLLARVMENLLSNAWKFTSKKHQPHIEFGMAKKSPVPVYFVKDNGAGFKPEYSEQLFAPFRRLHSNKEFPGNGIGLATVQRIIHRHGGKIWAEGEVDRGAIFYFTLQPQEGN